jgi:hypothetical protein
MQGCQWRKATLSLHGSSEPLLFDSRTRIYSSTQADQLASGSHREALCVERTAGRSGLTDDELRVAIDRAEAKRAELLAVQPADKQSATVCTVLLRAADAYRR